MRIRRTMTPKRAGFAVLLVVLILLIAMSVLVVSNALVLRHWKLELDLVEQQQVRRLSVPPVGRAGNPRLLEPAAPPKSPGQSARRPVEAGRPRGGTEIQ